MAAKKPNIIIKGTPRNHVDWRPLNDSGTNKNMKNAVLADGYGARPVFEHVPNFFKRGSDNTLSGPNNTLIVMGRDRYPEAGTEVWSQDELERNEQSGYSHHMGAGAIDIVVGRGAPFPVDTLSNGKKFYLGPLYNTWQVSEDVPELKGLQLTQDFIHPGVFMDAARIYISQMTDVDTYFNIKSPLKTIGWPGGNKSIAKLDNRLEKPGLAATSAILLKADKIRMHSRENIKIVTKGPFENMNSQGNFIATEDVGIHLVANNGRDVNDPSKEIHQHPMVLGSNLELALSDMVELIEETVRIINNVVTAQNNFNQVVANHFHLGGTGPVVFDFFSAWSGIVTSLQLLTTGTMQNYFENINLAGWKSRYLTDSPNNEKYINSRYNTVN